MLACSSGPLLAAFCGALAGAGFGWPGGWLLVQLGLTGALYLLLAETRPKNAAWLLCVFVFVFHGVGESGPSVAVSATFRPWTVGLLVAVACFQAVLAGLTALLAFQLPLSTATRFMVALPALWVGRELLNSRLEASVPWLAVGYAHAPDGPLASLFPIGGVFLVSGAAVFTSAVVALALRREMPGSWVSKALGTLAVLATLLLIGRAEWTRPGDEAVVELLQSGAAAGDDTSGERLRRDLGHYARGIASSNARLIVTPQLAIPKTPESLPAGYLAMLAQRLKARGADALIGLYVESAAADRYYNGVESIGASGNQQYLKRHPFPFGEYLPLPGAFKQWLDSVLDHPRTDLMPGPAAPEPLIGGGLRLAVAVCYDIVFGDDLRVSSAQADTVVVLASDSSHDSPQLARQTRQIVQARALELQKPIVRTSDVRGTYFVDARGTVSGELPANVRDSSAQALRGRTGLTPYARWGDMCVAGLVAASLLLCFPLANAAMTVRGSLFSPRRRGRIPSGRRAVRQSGQVLPAALALLLIVAGFFYFMVNAGQTITEKIRVTNAADAAAYSAAVVEARALNYDAYMNRAMLANQMAIAQFVSFASWLDYFATAADNFGSYVTDINYFMFPNPKSTALEVAFGGSAVVAAYFGGQTVHSYLDEVVNYGSLVVPFYDAATTALARSQQAVQANLLAGIRQGQIANQVVKAMDPKLDAEVVLVSHGFDAFTKNYSGDERTRFADVAMRSRGLFTRERNFTLDSADIPFVRKDGALKKRGGTDLVGLDEWRGVDTLELHGRRFFCKLHWCDDVKTPIGWGGVEVDANGGDAGHGYHGNAYHDNPTTADKADEDMKSPYMGGYSGIPTSQEIADTDPKKTATTAITILVSKAHADTLTSGNAATVGPSGRLAVFDDHPAGGNMMALGRAEVYFDRIAARADGKEELGSLYNPYWRVRLVAATNADRVYAASRQGGLLVPSLPASK